jgi:hypothetical protein
MPGRAYGRPSESRHHMQAMRAEVARHHAVNSGAIPGGTVLEHRHRWEPVGGDCMACTSRRCHAVRALTEAEFRAKYGFVPARPAAKRRALPLWPLPAVICGVIAWAGQSADSAPAVIAAGVGMLLLLVVWVRQ